MQNNQNFVYLYVPIPIPTQYFDIYIKTSYKNKSDPGQKKPYAETI